MPDLHRRFQSVRLLCAALAAGGLLNACVSLESDRGKDYVGPARGGPTAAVQEATPPATLPPSAAEAPALPKTPEPSRQPEPGPLKLTVPQALLLALENNRALVVERLNTPIIRTFEDQARAAFDPDLTGQFSITRARDSLPTALGDPTIMTQNYFGQLGLTEFLPTGTTIGLFAATTYYKYPPTGGPFVPYVSGPTLNVTQSLLRGFGIDVNLATLRQARIDTLTSQYELRGFAEALVARTETTYWDYALTLRQIEIYTQSLNLAQQQLDETRERIRLGRLAETELAAAEAELALRRENLINANSRLEATRLALLRLMNPGNDPFARELFLVDQPVVRNLSLDPLQDHLQVAQEMRSDLNQARLQVSRGDLQIVKTRNGLLPQLDLFINLGQTGYADTFAQSWRRTDGHNYDVTVGLNLEYPLGNRAAQASNANALLSRDQSLQAVNNLSQLVEMDVRLAFVEIQRAREQMAATAATRRLQEAKLNAETEKYRVGRSTALQVAQVQRDLLSSQIDEINAVAQYLKDRVDLYRLEGTLLVRRGVAAPGEKPPAGSSWMNGSN